MTSARGILGLFSPCLNPLGDSYSFQIYKWYKWSINREGLDDICKRVDAISLWAEI